MSPAVSVLEECRMIRHPVCQIKAAEPATGQVDCQVCSGYLRCATGEHYLELLKIYGQVERVTCLLQFFGRTRLRPARDTADMAALSNAACPDDHATRAEMMRLSRATVMRSSTRPLPLVPRGKRFWRSIRALILPPQTVTNRVF